MLQVSFLGDSTLAKKREKPDTSSEVEFISGGPTKRFFVSMLPRDIALEDALLDLIDNSVDGAMRQEKSRLKQKTPFDGYFAKLALSKNGFEITDNCGGIPKDYIEAAFSLGRPKIDKDNKIPTIGMYGIGMKRAVFKVGNEALIQSNSKDGLFEVEYSHEWMDPDNSDWNLPIIHAPHEKKMDRGVTITITDVKAEIRKSFANDDFLNSLAHQVSEHFGYLIQKGFAVSINNEELKPKTLQLINATHSAVTAIRPFDYEAKINGVDVKVTVGFFRSLMRETELDDELDGPRETELAGVSVVCNDRVVLLSDRSMKTGWGDGGVPRYHPQFRAIAGLVVFSSNEAENLPISTTKRDLDVGSEVYLKARRALMEGLKICTDFTNKWKGMEDQTEQHFQSERSDAKTQVNLANKHGSAVRGEPSTKKYIPKLPLPDVRDPKRRVSFVRKESDVKIVSEYLFDDAEEKPSRVGEECFDRVLGEIEKK